MIFLALVVDISCQNPVYIKKTNIYATNKPYYLSRSSKFICNDYSTERVYVCNLEGDILATLQDHGIFLNYCKYSVTYGFHITKSEDIIISVCRRDRSDPYTINVTSIVTGKCLAKISSDISNCSQIRVEALTFHIRGFAYDERMHEIFTANHAGICCVWSNRFCKDVRNANNYPQLPLSDDSSDSEPDDS